jgi:hypothetical protein
MVFYTCNKHCESSREIAWELLVVVVFVQVKNAQDLESWNGHIVFILSCQDCLVYFEWIYVFMSFIDRYPIADILG